MDTKFPTVFALIVTLASCSSGGSGGAAPTANLTSANARATSKSSYQAARSLFTLGIDTQTTGTRPAAFEELEIGDEPRFDLRSFLRGHVHGLITSALVRSATTVTTTDGSVGGTLVETFNDNDNDQTLSSGDTFDLVFSDYTNTFGSETETTNGQIFVSNIVVSGDPGGSSFSLSLRITFVNLVAMVTVGSEVESETFHGTVSIQLSLQGNVETFELTTNSSISGIDVGMRIRQTFTDNTPAPSSWTSDYSGSFSDAAIGGRVSFSTPTVFAGSGDPEHDNPSSGVFVIVGADNDTLTLTVIDNTQARIDLDQGGDGSIEFTETVSWSDLN